MRIIYNLKEGLGIIAKAEPTMAPRLNLCSYKSDKFGSESFHYHFRLKRFKDGNKAFYEEIPIIDSDGYYCEKIAPKVI